MNTHQISNILSSDCELSTSFVGVFASDRLPKHCEQPAALICNLDPHNQPGSHWVAIYIENDIGEYFDSYGLPPLNKNIVSFLQNNCQEWKFRNEELQAINSDVCGHYCIWYLLQKIQVLPKRKGGRLQKLKSNEWPFKENEGESNDIIVVHKLRRRFGHEDFYRGVIEENCQCCLRR